MSRCGTRSECTRDTGEGWLLLLLRLSQLTVRVRACRRSSFARRRDDRAIYCILLFDFEWFPLVFSFSGASRRRWREKWVPGRPSRLATTELQAWSAAVCRLLQPGGTTAFGVCALPGAADVTPSISRRRRRRRRCCEYRGVRMPQGGEVKNVRRKKKFVRFYCIHSLPN